MRRKKVLRRRRKTECEKYLKKEIICSAQEKRNVQGKGGKYLEMNGQGKGGTYLEKEI